MEKNIIFEYEGKVYSIEIPEGNVCDDNTIDIMFSLGTSNSDLIEYNVNDMNYECKDEIIMDDDFWENVNTSVEKFEKKYKYIIGNFVSGVCREEGHCDDNAYNTYLVGSCFPTINEIIEILKTAENEGDGWYIYTSTSGNLSVKELDLLPSYVDATLSFKIPDEIVNQLDDIIL